MSKARTFKRILEPGVMEAYRRAVYFDAEPGEGPVRSSGLVFMNWLADPVIREMIVEACPPGTLPLQTRQLVRVGGEPVGGREYSMSVTLTVEPDQTPRRVTMSYDVVSEESTMVAAGELEFLCIEAGTGL